jgi:hypothetical protein
MYIHIYIYIYIYICIHIIYRYIYLYEYIYIYITVYIQDIKRQEQQNKMHNQQQKQQQHLQQQKQQQSSAPFVSSKPQLTATPFASSKPQNFSAPFASTGPGGGVRAATTGGSSSAPFASSSTRSILTEVHKPQEVNLFESFDTPSIKAPATVNKPSGGTSWYGSKKIPPSAKNDPFGLDDSCGSDPFAPSGVSVPVQTRPTSGSIFNTSSLSGKKDVFGLSLKDDDEDMNTRTRSESETVMQKFRQMYDLDTPEKEGSGSGSQEGEGEYDFFGNKGTPPTGRPAKSAFLASNMSSREHDDSYGYDKGNERHADYNDRYLIYVFIYILSYLYVYVLDDHIYVPFIYRSNSDDQDQGASEGIIMARISTRSLFTKEWNEFFYVFQDGSLLLFKNRSDYQYNPRGSMSAVKKKIPIVHNLRMMKIKTKDYGKGKLLHNFMLEEVMDYGPTNVAKFGGSNKVAVERFFNELKNQILSKRHNKM